MRFPQINHQNGKAHKITNVTGIASAIHPAFHSLDRLQDSLNVFNKDGILTNRNGFLKTSKQDITDFRVTTTNEQVFFADFPFTEFQGFNTLGMLAREEIMAHTTLDFFVLDDLGNMKKLFCQEIVAANGYTVFQVVNAYFIKSTPISGSGIFLVLPLIRIDIRQDITTKELRIFEFESDFSHLVPASTSQFYCPLIMKHGHGDHAPTISDVPILETQYPEGVNLLNGAFEADFTLDACSDTFRLPVSIKDDCRIVIHFYTGETAFRTFTVPQGSDSSESQEFLDVNLYFKVDRAKGIIRTMSENGLYILPRYREHNSLRIFAYTDTGDAPYKLFSHRSRPIVFDGRMFFPGGEGSDNKIYYSGKNQPLYYCEENSFAVGDSLDAVTTLSKQGRYIIAFKEREIYRITLTETAAVNREKAIDDDTVKKFPQPNIKTLRINDTIGCDRPSTVRNCSNRLVWYHSDGGVYTLYGSNLYTEGSVYELSSEIKDKLKALSDEEKKNIKALEIHGRYALATRKAIFIMDTDVSGFAYLSGHKSADKNYSGLPWFYWQPPRNMNIINGYTKRDENFFILSSDDYEHYYIAHLTGSLDTVYEGDTEKTEPPEFYFTTALMGEDGHTVDRFSFDAVFSRFAEATIYDINGDKVVVPVMNYDRFIHYHIPLSYPKGKLGIKIKGSGDFALHYITCITKA